MIGLAEQLHENKIKLVLDGVFNHVGRNFFAFKDLQLNKDVSVYKEWFCGVDFEAIVFIMMDFIADCKPCSVTINIDIPDGSDLLIV